VASQQRPASSPAYLSAKNRLSSDNSSVHNHIFVDSEDLVFVVVVVGLEAGFVSEVEYVGFVTEVGLGLGLGPGAMAADSVPAGIVAVESVAEAEAFG